MSSCYHCGDHIKEISLELDKHYFCCHGCISVYQLLQSHHLNSFYSFEKQAGIKPNKIRSHQFDFLDVNEIRSQYIDFEDENQAKITLYLPNIHCSSCIYLLENIKKLNEHISQAHIHFAKKEASFTFNPQHLKLSQLATLLSNIGYEPNFGKRTSQNLDKKFLYKLGVAGFAFGSIMLWSFPEYLGVARDNPEFRKYTSYLSLAVSIPVLLYAARDYFISAFKALRYGKLNLDVPIAIGIIALYAQSLWSILLQQGPGYIDSFSGFIFFLLIGKWFQQKTYKSLSFERDYTSYFPVAVIKMDHETEQIVTIENLQVHDHIRIRNEEIIPCDSILLSDEAQIDFSFVTGESNLIFKKKGDLIYAGGKLSGKMIDLEVKNQSNRGHLTLLWNELKDKDKDENRVFYQDKISVYFLSIVTVIAIVSGFCWWFIDPNQVTRIVVSILIVTCPCALALSSPFTLGNLMRLLGRNGLYLKNTSVIESMNEVTDLVFDKTGTLSSIQQQVSFDGNSDLNDFEKKLIWTCVSESTHPLSIAIKQSFGETFNGEKFIVLNYNEVASLGISAEILSPDNQKIKIQLGSSKLIGIESISNYELHSFLSIENQYRGKFVFQSNFREGLSEMLDKLQEYQLHVLTGDNSKDKVQLQSFFPSKAKLYFEQSPNDKLLYIRNLQQQGKKVLMVGDGLNDAGALQEAQVGIAVSENSFRFTPAADAILASEKLIYLPKMLATARKAKLILAICLSFSICYNLVGLSFAISGQLTPLVAAILMPISSITVVFISTFSVWIKRFS